MNTFILAAGFVSTAARSQIVSAVWSHFRDGRWKTDAAAMNAAPGIANALKPCGRVSATKNGQPLGTLNASGVNDDDILGKIPERAA